MISKILHAARKWIYDFTLEERVREKNWFSNPPVQQWSVEVQYNSHYFYDQQLAHEFATQHQVPHSNIRSYLLDTIEPRAMQWLIAQRDKNMDVGSLGMRINQAHPDNFDDMLAWFEREPSALAANALLNLSFALKRKDATVVVARWAKDHPNDWFDPTNLVEDPFKPPPIFV